MAGVDFIFNIAKGKIHQYHENVDSNSPAASRLGMLLLINTSLEADATLRDHDTVSALLAGTSSEPTTTTNYARQFATDTETSAATIDDTNDRVDLDVADFTFTTLGNGVNSTIAKGVLYYDPDGTDTDTGNIPLAAYNIDFTTDGSTVTLQVNASGWGRAA